MSVNCSVIFASVAKFLSRLISHVKRNGGAGAREKGVPAHNRRYSLTMGFRHGFFIHTGLTAYAPALRSPAPFAKI